MKKLVYAGLGVLMLLLATVMPSEAWSRNRVFIGPVIVSPWYGYGPVWWGPPVWANPYPYPWVGAYPYAYSPPVAVEPAPPPAYIEPAPQQVWYFCENPQGYYPYVSQCPGGWRQVVPQPAPGQ